ncbi:VMAP-C domain-containing protein, partial [Scytonema sp. NUACC21]
MTFGVDDYEKAITRIFDSKGNVVGTGFLIAPGYVLTCAHVVLQAMGIKIEEYPQHVNQPQESIALDFHVLASRQTIYAKVVAWLPYNLESGDVAALKLLTPQPKRAKPIPLIEVSRAEVENDPHSVYGFGKSVMGGRSDAYRPKANVAGGRFQLCRYGDPNDETIAPGFSGAPVWNDSRQGVVGMVATAGVVREQQQSTAYAIPTRELQRILRQVDAFCLHDILTHSLQECSSDRQLHFSLKTAINTALQHCNPNGSDRSWQQQLVELSIDRAATPGWETEGRLVHFAMILAWMKDTPQSALKELKAWVERCGHNYSDLFVRIDSEMRQKNVSRSNECECLMVAVEQVETSTDKLRVSLWAVPNLETHNPNNPPMPLVLEEELSRQELPVFVRKKIRDKLGKKPTPTIHLFVPRMLFGYDFEMLTSSNLGAVLGSEYPFVVRTNLKTHPIGRYYYDDWHEKWEQVEKAFENNTCEVAQFIDCSLPEEDLIPELVET